jgi:hypothetical protein
VCPLSFVEVSYFPSLVVCGLMRDEDQEQTRAWIKAHLDGKFLTFRFLVYLNNVSA